MRHAQEHRWTKFWIASVPSRDPQRRVVCGLKPAAHDESCATATAAAFHHHLAEKKMAPNSIVTRDCLRDRDPDCRLWCAHQGTRATVALVRNVRRVQASAGAAYAGDDFPPPLPSSTSFREDIAPPHTRLCLRRSTLGRLEAAWLYGRHGACSSRRIPLRCLSRGRTTQRLA